MRGRRLHGRARWENTFFFLSPLVGENTTPAGGWLLIIISRGSAAAACTGPLTPGLLLSSQREAPGKSSSALEGSPRPCVSALGLTTDHGKKRDYYDPLPRSYAARHE